MYYLYLNCNLNIELEIAIDRSGATSSSINKNHYFKKRANNIIFPTFVTDVTSVICTALRWDFKLLDSRKNCMQKWCGK